MLKNPRPHLTGMVIMVLLPIMLSISPQRIVAESCNFVELRPGYPGYLGYVTGVDGIGDHACEEDLEREDPSFSKRVEDRENRRAARRLGIRGSEELWTWENWLAIESERGLSPTCYMCAFNYAEERREPSGTDVEYSDPRLQCGTPGQYSIQEAYAYDNDMAPLGNYMEDYQLRPLAVLTSSNGHLNAEELIDAYAGVLETYYYGRGSIPRLGYYWDIIVERGGYFELPGEASVEDQVALVYIAMYPFSFYMPPPSWSGVLSRVKEAELEWRDQIRTGNTDMSFREYLDEGRVLCKICEPPASFGRAVGTLVMGIGP